MPVWIVLNNSGNEWGRGGYLLLSRNGIEKDRKCGITTRIFYVSKFESTVIDEEWEL